MSDPGMIIELERDGLVRLPNLQGARVACLGGAIWITQDGDPNDIVLEPGASYRINRKGALVQAVRKARIAIEAPEGLLLGRGDFAHTGRAWLPAAV